MYGKQAMGGGRIGDGRRDGIGNAVTSRSARPACCICRMSGRHPAQAPAHGLVVSVPCGQGLCTYSKAAIDPGGS